MDKQRFVIFLVIVAMIVLIGGCNGQDVVSPVKNTLTPERIQLTSTIVLQKTTPSSTSTLTPTSTSTIITPASLPTFSQMEIDQAIKNLIETNGGCALPCWWGIIPGETTWFAAKQQLEQLNAEIKSTEPADIIIGGQAHTVVYHSVIVYTKNFPRGIGARFRVIDKTEISIILAGGNSTGAMFELHKVLSIYNEPDNISINTFTGSPDNIIPFYLVLYYPEHYFGVGYDLLGNRKGELIIGCPETKIPLLWIWAPRSSIDIGPEYIQGGLIGYENRNNFLTIEEATSLSIKDFSQEFKDEYGLNCLETLAELWE